MTRRRVGVRSRATVRGRLSWVGWTMAPWCIAAGALVSFVADAGHEAAIGMTRSALNSPPVAFPSVLVPALDGGTDRFGGPQAEAGQPLIQLAHLFVGEPADLLGQSDEIEPKDTLKSEHTPWPGIDRDRKGDPAIGLRPSFDARLRRGEPFRSYLQSAQVFGARDTDAPPLTFEPASRALADLGALFPAPVSTALIMAKPDSKTAPQQLDGSTPAIAADVTLASSTPVVADLVPIGIAPLPKYSRDSDGHLATANSPVMAAVDQAPAFASLADLAQSSREQRCLAEAIYFEARSETEEGQAAVAQVVLNRVMSGLYPTSICGVVFQNRERRNACQFSFACEGHALHISEEASWLQASRVAQEVLDGATYVSDIGVSTHYHANYVRPDWARRLVKMDQIGHHVFYRLRPGQT